MDERALNRTRAEIVFAELLVEDATPSPDRVHELCVAHPELAPELERMHAQLADMHNLLPWALPASPRGGTDERGAPDLGAFRCERLLGRGGMGEVWQARDLALGRGVAVKLMSDPLASDAQLQRFQREAQAAGRVQHPCIVAVHQTGTFDGRPFIVQELVPGGRTLRDHIAEMHRLPELPADHARRVAERFARLADALVAAHAAGIVHRDLKPQNVLLMPSGEPKIADFGLAQLASVDSLSRTGEFLGTCFYASPEQIEGDGGALDERSDVFSLAATMYENLTLRRAFDGDSVRQVMRSVTVADPPAPHLLRGRVPRDLSLIVMKALEKRPQDRYASMAELRDDLLRYLENRPVRARPASLQKRASKWALRHPTRATALCLSLVAGAALGALFVRSERARGRAEDAQAATSRANASLLEAAREIRAEKELSDEVLAFLVGMFESAGPSVSGEHAPTVRHVVDDAIARLRGGGVQEPLVRARLLGVLGEVQADVGGAASARGVLADALALWDEAGRASDPAALEAALSLAVLDGEFNDLASAERRLATIAESLAAEPALAPRFAVRMHVARASALGAAGRLDECGDELARARERYAEQAPDAKLDMTLRCAEAFSALARNRPDDARAILEELVAEHEDLVALGVAQALDAVNLLGMIALNERRFDEAERIFVDLCERTEASLAPDHDMVLMCRTNLGRALEGTGRYAEAEALYRDNAARIEAKYGRLNAGVLANRHNVASSLVHQGRMEEAEEVFADVLEKCLDLYGEEHVLTTRIQHNLANVLTALGRHAEALELQEQSVAHTPPGDPSAAGRRTQLESIRAKAEAAE